MATVAEKIASLVAARANCRESGNTEWLARHGEALDRILRDYMPSGSGFDVGTTLEEDECRRGARLVFTTEFHHMNEMGFYDGWTSHRVTVYPSFLHTLDIRISGRDRNDIKELIHDRFYDALTAAWNAAEA